MKILSFVLSFCFIPTSHCFFFLEMDSASKITVTRSLLGDSFHPEECKKYFCANRNATANGAECNCQCSDVYPVYMDHTQRCCQDWKDLGCLRNLLFKSNPIQSNCWAPVISLPSDKAVVDLKDLRWNSTSSSAANHSLDVSNCAVDSTQKLKETGFQLLSGKLFYLNNSQLMWDKTTYGSKMHNSLIKITVNCNNLQACILLRTLDPHKVSGDKSTIETTTRHLNMMEWDYAKAYNSTDFPWLNDQGEIIPEAERTWAKKMYFGQMNHHDDGDHDDDDDDDDDDDNDDSDDWQLPTIIGAANLLAFLLVLLCVVFIKRQIRRRNKIKKIIDWGGSGLAGSKKPGRKANIYSIFSGAPPDLWEVKRENLEIFMDQKLGSGTFGTVYKGVITLPEWLRSNTVTTENPTRNAAIKMLPAYAESYAKSEFLNEINLMKTIGQHIHVVSMLGCASVDGPLCLVVEYCSDGDLLKFLRHKKAQVEELRNQTYLSENDLGEPDTVPFSTKDLLSFAWQSADGLEYISSKGFVHRDVAARNVMVDNGRLIKIGDFGLTRRLTNDGAYVSQAGRFPIKWMAIESIRFNEYTTRSDVWSFGVLLFEIITMGEAPYPSIHPAKMEEHLSAGHVMEKPDNCHEDLYTVMRSCWNLKSEFRPEFSALKDSLRRMLETASGDNYYYLKLDGTTVIELE